MTEYNINNKKYTTMNYCIYNKQTDEARHTTNKGLAMKLFDKVSTGYLSEVTDNGETIICEK